MLSRQTLFFFMFTGVLNWGVRLEAAKIYMTAADGTKEMDLVDTGEMQIRLDTAAYDTLQIAFLYAFLDTTSDIDDVAVVDVIAVTAGNRAPWIYDRTAFEPLPTELELVGDEYGLISGDITLETGGYPLGNATYIHDTLLLQNTTGVSAGYIEVRFEVGARIPQAFGPGPDYYPYRTCYFGPGCGFPNELYLGENYNNSPLVINLIPEPGGVILESAGAVLILSARPKRRQDGNLR